MRNANAEVFDFNNRTECWYAEHFIGCPDAESLLRDTADGTKRSVLVAICRLGHLDGERRCGWRFDQRHD